MKILKVLTLILVVVSKLPSSEKITVGNFHAGVFDKISEKFENIKCKISVSYKEKITSYNFDLDTKDYNIESVFFAINTKEKEKIILFLLKFLEWNKKAIEKKVKLEKDIGTLTLRNMTYYHNDTWDWSQGDITFSFFSQNEKRHQLVLRLRSFFYLGKFKRLAPDLLFYVEVKNVQKIITKLEDNFVNLQIKKFIELQEDFK